MRIKSWLGDGRYPRDLANKDKNVLYRAPGDPPDEFCVQEKESLKLLPHVDAPVLDINQKIIWLSG